MGTRMQCGHLGTNRGSVLFREGRELYEFLEINIDTRNDAFVVIGIKTYKACCEKLGFTEADCKAWAEEAANLHRVLWI